MNHEIAECPLIAFHICLLIPPSLAKLGPVSWAASALLGWKGDPTNGDACMWTRLPTAKKSKMHVGDLLRAHFPSPLSHVLLCTDFSPPPDDSSQLPTLIVTCERACCVHGLGGVFKHNVTYIHILFYILSSFFISLRWESGHIYSECWGRQTYVCFDCCLVSCPSSSSSSWPSLTVCRIPCLTNQTASPPQSVSQFRALSHHRLAWSKLYVFSWKKSVWRTRTFFVSYFKERKVYPEVLFVTGRRPKQGQNRSVLVGLLVLVREI